MCHQPAWTVVDTKTNGLLLFCFVFFSDGNLTRSRGLLLLSKKEIKSASTSVFQYLTGAETLFDRGFLQAEVRHVVLLLVLLLF